MNKQIFYQQGKAGKYFLSPYVDIIKLNNSKAILRRRDTKKQVVLIFSSENVLEHMLKIMQDGIQREEVVEVFGRIELFELLLRNGVVE